MVERAGGYYGTDFRGERGVTQGELLSPTIFNVVVDAVVRHWVTGIITELEARGELGQEGRHQAALFYADDGMVASLDPIWMQGAFNALHPDGFRRGNHAVVGVKQRRLMPPLLSQLSSCFQLL